MRDNSFEYEKTTLCHSNVAVGLPLDLDTMGPPLTLIIRLRERNVRGGHLGLNCTSAKASSCERNLMLNDKFR